MSEKTQQQFLHVIDRDEAEKRFHDAVSLTPVGKETVSIHDGLGRVLAEDVVAAVDVPSFDRSNFDGFALRAADTFGADEENPKSLQLMAETIATAVIPESQIVAGYAVSIATGGMIPRGADAILMVEHSDVSSSNADDLDTLFVQKPVTPGFGISFAGTDMAQGEIVLRRGDLLTSRETGTLAAIGVTEVTVWKRPTVAVISTGDEIIPPGEPMRPGLIYDSNARIIADAVHECGGIPEIVGIVRDDFNQLKQYAEKAIGSADVVIMSGGTSKGAGDLCYKIVSEMNDPGIVVHGVALKPGKPVCLAATRGKPVVVLPGFPTSAVFTFHEFVAPVIRKLAGRSPENPEVIKARLATKVNSEIGRTEYMLVGLVAGEANEGRGSTSIAFPMGKGSGSVTTFSRADGFITIDRNTEIIERDDVVSVTILGQGSTIPDLVVIGSHCMKLDSILSQLQDRGIRVKFLAVGSTAGLHAAQRGECDVAGIHLFDPKTNDYNRPFIDDSVELVQGYARRQGFVFRNDDERFANATAAAEAISIAVADQRCLMINRNQGSGTRLLIDRELDGARPSGYAVQAKNHNAVLAAIEQRRADWGVAIESVATRPGIGFLPLIDEQFDFAIPKRRRSREAVEQFVRVVEENRPPV